MVYYSTTGKKLLVFENKILRKIRDLETLEVTNRENRIQDRNDWRTVTVTAEILTEL